MPAVSKSYPAAKALALDYPLLPVVNSNKQFIGIVLKDDLLRLVGGSGAESAKPEPEPRETEDSNINLRSEQDVKLQISQNQSEPKKGKAVHQTLDPGSWWNGKGDQECENQQELERTILLRRIGLVVYSGKMMDLVDLALRVARVDSTVLLSGESGVGKELLAQLIHDQSGRSLGPFVKINCGAIPENLLESELFGYEGGAFTGANRQGKMGQFELATGGTLFLDEIGELPLSLQVKLLRAIQEQEFVRVGGTKPRKVDLRLVAATNRDLEQMVLEGKFRKDLYFRLNVIPMYVPPLRERRDDILPLIHTFQRKFTQRFKTEKDFTPEVLRFFLAYAWPGNVRELENIIERLFVTTPDRQIGKEHLPPRLFEKGCSANITVENLVPLRVAMEEVECALIKKALQEHTSLKAAALALQIDQSTLGRKIARFREQGHLD